MSVPSIVSQISRRGKLSGTVSAGTDTSSNSNAPRGPMLRKIATRIGGRNIFPLLFVGAIYSTLLMSSSLSFHDAVPNFNTKNEEPKDSEHFLITQSKDQTYTGDCKKRYLNNVTWGKSVAEFVDKVAAKEVVRRFNVPWLKIIPTIAFYNDANISSFTLDVFEELNMGNGAIIKPAHSSGGVASIYNGTYHCFKKCKKLDYDNNGKAISKKREPMKREHIAGQESEAFLLARQMMEMELKDLYHKAETETQYQFIPRGIIVEERLPVETMMEYHWWVVNGHPVFVCLRCSTAGESRAGSYYTSQFRQLNIKMEGLPPCSADMEQPKTWNRMVQMVKTLSQKLPKGIIRIDLYASEKDIYFSEFTYTSNGCRFYYSPLVADAFLYGALYGIFTPEQLTPAFIEAAINQRFWYVVPFIRHKNQKDNVTHNALWDMSVISPHPNDWTSCRRAKLQSSNTATEQCFGTVNSLEKAYPLRCIGVTVDDMVFVGLWREASFQGAIERVDWQWAVGVGAVFIVLVVSGTGHQQKKWQIETILLYLAAVAMYKYTHHSNMGMFSTDSLWTTAVDSYYAFGNAHPMTSQFIAWTHIATYWFQIAAWRSKTVQGVLFWYFLYESVTSFVNEYAHQTEYDRQVRCLRMTFIHVTQQYAVNDILRFYLLPPFFVYIYLLPKLVFHWIPFMSNT